MKITKTKEVVIEEVEVLPGTYYFKCTDGEYHKMELGETDEDRVTNYRCTYVSNFSDIFSIKVREDYTYDEEGLPYKFSDYVREISGKKIEKEEFEQQKQEVINKIIKF